MFFVLAFLLARTLVLISGRSVSGGGVQGGLLMLYQPAEGERQRRPRPIQRPQCNSSRMPSIPMCCVKVEPPESYERAFLTRATLNTHRQSSSCSVWCSPTSADLNAVLRWESVTKMPGLAKSLLHLSCPLEWSWFISLGTFIQSKYPSSYRARLPWECICHVTSVHLLSSPKYLRIFVSHDGRMYQKSLAKFFFSVTSPKIPPLCQVI